MTDTRMDLVTLQPACLFGLNYKPSDLEPEATNQLDLDLSQRLFHDAFNDGARQAAKAHSVRIEVRAKQFMPDELAGTGRGGAVSGAFELLQLAIGPDGELLRDIASQVIASWIELSVGNIKTRLSAEGGILTEGSAPHFKPRAALALCENHARTVLLESPVGDGQILEPVVKISETSTLARSTTIVIRLGEGELVYVIDHLLRAQSIVRVTSNEMTLLDTDAWNAAYFLTSTIEWEV